MKAFDLNVVRLMKLPEDAIQMITEYLKTEHPIARMVKDLDFFRYSSDTVSSLVVSGLTLPEYRQVAVWNHPPLLPGIRIMHHHWYTSRWTPECKCLFQCNLKTGTLRPRIVNEPYIRLDWPWGDIVWVRGQTLEWIANSREYREWFIHNARTPGWCMRRCPDPWM